MAAYLRDRGRDVTLIDLVPGDGRASIRMLAKQVAEAVDRLRDRSKVERVDLVGHSMGALVSRTYVQREEGKGSVRRFVSIAGPHKGSPLAHAMAVELFAGIRDMRPGSDHIKDLEQDEDPWGPVEVHCIYTGWDLLIRPVETAILAGAKSVHRIDVKLHRWLPQDARVLDRIASLLGS